MSDCVFCKIISGEIPAYRVYEDGETLAFLDIANDIYGHTLVIPKKHFENVLDCEKTILKDVMSTCQKVAKHYVDNCGFDGVNILNASSEAAEQSVFHLHFHILPRKTGDGFKTFPKFEGSNDDLLKIQEKLKF